MGDTSKNGGMTMDHHTSIAEGMAREGHSMSIPIQASRIGKKYATDFRLLAADVAASKNLAVDGDPGRPGPPYAKLRATKPNAFSKDKPVREIRFTLDGDMERYVWFLNNKPLSESDSIRIREGEVARFIMINRTMMHHPMHLHGQFFRVINGQGDYTPLKHTVDVASMSTTVIEFDANEFGDWFFHCHLLYHMKGGMARVVHYEGFTLDPQLAEVRPNLYKDFWYFWGQGDVLTNMTEGFLMFSNTRNILTAEWELGWQEVDDTEWEGIFTYDRYINRFLSIFAGAYLLGERDELDETRGVFGFRYLLPLNLESRAWIDTDGGARFNLGKSFELTPRLALYGEAQFDTHDKWEGRTRLSYLVHKNLSVVGQWHSDYGFGGGLQIRF
ncbi:MAG: multicopper oxidase domain-containing protein [Deltaproteobacteria bacterium]|nr:multicopper oxidase domain-containing protein [Deltaproteobacteria bacterium]